MSRSLTLDEAIRIVQKVADMKRIDVSEDMAEAIVRYHTG